MDNLKIKHAENCLIELIGESEVDRWVMGLPVDISDRDYYLQLHKEILNIRASAINDTSKREIIIISQYFPNLEINAR